MVELAWADTGISAMVLTGYASDIIREKGLNNDGPRIVSKPIAPSDLLAAVREILDQRR